MIHKYFCFNAAVNTPVFLIFGTDSENRLLLFLFLEVRDSYISLPVVLGGVARQLMQGPSILGRGEFLEQPSVDTCLPGRCLEGSHYFKSVHL
jgi:hypothetical protein